METDDRAQTEDMADKDGVALIEFDFGGIPLIPYASLLSGLFSDPLQPFASFFNLIPFGFFTRVGLNGAGREIRTARTTPTTPKGIRRRPQAPGNPEKRRAAFIPSRATGRLAAHGRPPRPQRRRRCSERASGAPASHQRTPARRPPDACSCGPPRATGCA